LIGIAKKEWQVLGVQCPMQRHNARCWFPGCECWNFNQTADLALACKAITNILKTNAKDYFRMEQRQLKNHKVKQQHEIHRSWQHSFGLLCPWFGQA
jgi:hypothetical protein